MRADPKNVKKILMILLYFFTLLGSTHVEAAQRALVKLTPGVNFINVLRTAFALVAPKSVRIQSCCQYLFTLLGSTSAKAACGMFVKLTPDFHSC